MVFVLVLKYIFSQPCLNIKKIDIIQKIIYIEISESFVLSNLFLEID